MTALQTIIKEAKNIKKTYPNRFAKWTDYVKQASAIYASKHKGKSPVGKKKAVKKTAKKKAAPKKVAGYVKTIKKGGKTEVLYTNNKNAAKVKKYSKALKLVPGSAKQKSLFGVKKKAAKKPSEKSILNKIHKVKKDVDSLDEAQHKHMSGIEDKMFKDLYDTREKIANTKKAILKLQTFSKISPTQKHIFQNKAKQYKKYLVELNTHYRELKKHI
jgi:hypothetical protein